MKLQSPHYKLRSLSTIGVKKKLNLCAHRKCASVVPKRPKLQRQPTLEEIQKKKKQSQKEVIEKIHRSMTQTNLVNNFLSSLKSRRLNQEYWQENIGEEIFLEVRMLKTLEDLKKEKAAYECLELMLET